MTAYTIPGLIRDPSERCERRDAPGSILHRCFGFLAREYRIRRGMRAIMALEDRMLSDIGLTRAQVESAARFGRAGTD